MGIIAKMEAAAHSSKALSWAVAGVLCLIQPRLIQGKIDKAAEHFKVSNKEIRKNRFDIYFSRLYYRIGPEEYYRYHFPALSDVGRKQFVGDRESDPFFDAITPEEMRYLFKNKYAAYKKFKKYYAREAAQVEKPENFEEFEKFCTSHQMMVVKPLALHQGRGVRKVAVSEIGDHHKFFESLIVDGGAIIEELVEQDERMAAFHPQSINTVRVVVLNAPDNPQIVACSVRFGTGDSFVDNGCLSCGVDPETGVITSKGRTVHGKGLYLFHPDTGKQILGFHIPEWDALRAMTIEASFLAPEQLVIGWDTALSKKGWVIIEGNTNPAIQTLSAEGVGARDLLNLIKAHTC